VKTFHCFNPQKVSSQRGSSSLEKAAFGLILRADKTQEIRQKAARQIANFARSF
jgi:hypothetical protein